MQLDPNETDIYNGLGNVYYPRGEAYLAQNLWERALLELDLAIKSYQKAIGLDPNHANAHNGLGNVYCLQGKILLQQGDAAAALQVMEKKTVASFLAALKSRPQDALVLTNLRSLWQEIGWAHYRHNNSPQVALAFQESLLSYLDALDVSPTVALLKEAEDAMRPLLGILHQLPDNLTPAIIASIKKIYACQDLYHPELNEFALLNLANHYRVRKDYHLALTVAQEAGQTPELALAAINLEFALWAEDL